MRTLVFILFSALAIAAKPVQHHVSGKLYEVNSQKSKPTFLFKKVQTETPGKLTLTATYSSLDNKPITEELAEMTDGKFSRYEVRHHHANQNGSAVVRDGKLFFEYTSDGKSKTSEETISGTVVCSLTIRQFLADNKERILKGEALPVRYLVLDRRETIGFEYQKIEEFVENGVPMVKVRMKAQSFFVAAVVSPLYFYLDKEHMVIRRSVGRTVIKPVVNGSPIDVDADSYYLLED